MDAEMSAPPAPARPLSLRDAAAFFLPLVLVAQFMMISHTVILGWLARGRVPTESLAAFAIAFALNGLLSSVFRPFHQIALSFISDRRSIRRVWSFGMFMVLGDMAFIWAVALTPLGDWIYGGLLGAGPVVVREARQASLIFALIFPMQCTRNVAAGLLMVARRTLLITYGTVLRFASLVVLLIVLSRVLHGAPLGAAALVGCIWVEALFVVSFARPAHRSRPLATEAPPGYGEMWRFSWPLIANAMLENGLVVLINVFVGRLPDADLGLAAFGVARGLLMLMMSPLRNLAQTAQALTRNRDDLRKILRFSRFVMGCFMAIIAVLVYTPLRDVILADVMGLAPRLQAAVEPAVLLFLVTPPLWGLAAVYRGLLAGARQTGVLAVTGGARLVAVLAISSLALLWPHTNGAVLGVLALAGAFGFEAVLLGRSLRGYLRSGVAFPEGGGTRRAGPVLHPAARPSSAD
jgi:progressive ankylosis protein